MATRKKLKRSTKPKPASRQKIKGAKRTAKKKRPVKVTAKKGSRSPSRKTTKAGRRPSGKAPRSYSHQAGGSVGPESAGLPAGGQSGDLEGLRDIERADSESVDELLEEGNAFEADVVAGVEHADDYEEQEVHTHEVPEDDVPEEYQDKDS